MSLLYECVNTVIAGKLHFFVSLMGVWDLKFNNARSTWICCLMGTKSHLKSVSSCHSVLFTATSNRPFVPHYSVDLFVLWDAQPQC